MKKGIPKIFIALALLIVMGHSVVEHRHHDDVVVDMGHDHDDDDHHHRLFSFGDLDEDFLPARVQCQLPDDVSLFTTGAIALYSPDLSTIIERPVYFTPNESPPPDDHSFHYSLRGPPLTA